MLPDEDEDEDGLLFEVCSPRELGGAEGGLEELAFVLETPTGADIGACP